MDNESRKTFSKLVTLFTEESLTRAEFTEAFSKVVDEILRSRNENKEAVRLLTDFFEKLKTKLEKNFSASTLEMKATITAEFDKAFKDQTNTLNFLRDKMREHHEGMDKRDETLRSEFQSMIPPPQEMKTPPETLDEIESLKLKIKTLEDEIKALGEKRLGGGGTSAIGVQFALGKMWKTETPSGAINGSNVTYTVTQDIHTVFQFAINGQVLNDDEYTIAGKTITLNSAIPANLSGTSFRISYI